MGPEVGGDIAMGAAGPAGGDCCNGGGHVSRRRDGGCVDRRPSPRTGTRSRCRTRRRHGSRYRMLRWPCRAMSARHDQHIRLRGRTIVGTERSLVREARIRLGMSVEELGRLLRSRDGRGRSRVRRIGGHGGHRRSPKSTGSDGTARASGPKDCTIR